VSVHAHGLRQWTKMHMDGVPGITQCPIAPGSSFEYVCPQPSMAPLGTILTIPSNTRTDYRVLRYVTLLPRYFDGY
jgi:FtsP/CotA-like multicopper oxidase with cupredoxin domain